jgi:hypothetical protein
MRVAVDNRIYLAEGHETALDLEISRYSLPRSRRLGRCAAVVWYSEYIGSRLSGISGVGSL